MLNDWRCIGSYEILTLTNTNNKRTAPSGRKKPVLLIPANNYKAVCPFNIVKSCYNRLLSIQTTFKVV